MNTYNDTYFKTLSAALEAAEKVAKAKDLFTCADSVWFNFGSDGISYGVTKKASIELMDYKGNISKKCLQISLYRMDSGTYELTAYVS